MNALSRRQFGRPHPAAPLSLPSRTGRKAASRRITVAALDGWVERAAAGNVLEYHRGHLAADRFPLWTALSVRRCQELGRVADRVMALAEEGRVVLVQKRIDAERVAYLAIRTSRPAARKETNP